MKNEDFRICDKCMYFCISPGGCVEKCNAQRLDPWGMRDGYIEDRIYGNKKSCKGFWRLTADK